MKLNYARILGAMASGLWAIEPGRMAEIIDAVTFQAHGGKLSAEELREYVGLAGARAPRVMLVNAEANADGVRALLDVDAGDTFAAAMGTRAESNRPRGKAIAVIGVRGIIAHRMESVDNISGPGGTSIEGLRNRIAAAMEHDQIGAVVLDVDSPGGSVAGVEELAAEIHEWAKAGDKPIVAVANTEALSAAYYLASQASELVITPSGSVGSIGVFSAHQDISAKLAQEGEAITLIHAGPHKVEGHPFAPLSDEAREEMQKSVNLYYDQFIGAVSRGRNVPAASVIANMGGGRSVHAADALRAGMVDSVETLDSVIRRLQAQGAAPGLAPARGGRMGGPVDPAEFEFWQA